MVVPGSRDEGELVRKPVWRVKLVVEFETGETTEVEVARLERDDGLAAAAGSEAGTMGAGKTYDPDFLRSLDATGSRGDIARAIEWYRKAASLFGNRDAEKRLSSLAVAKAQPDYP